MSIKDWARKNPIKASLAAVGLALLCPLGAGALIYFLHLAGAYLILGTSASILLFVGSACWSADNLWFPVWNNKSTATVSESPPKFSSTSAGVRKILTIYEPNSEEESYDDMPGAIPRDPETSPGFLAKFCGCFFTLCCRVEADSPRSRQYRYGGSSDED